MVKNPVKHKELLVRVCLHGSYLETDMGGSNTTNLAKSFLRSSPLIKSYEKTFKLVSAYCVGVGISVSI